MKNVSSEKNKYKGELEKPIAISDKPTFLETIVRGGGCFQDSNSLWLSDNVHVPSEWLRKLGDLLTHYGISSDDPEKWFRLALALAINHAPAFSLKPRPDSGAKTQWDFFVLGRLFYEVNDLVSQGLAANPYQACQLICDQHERRKHYPLYKHNFKTLYRRYQEARNSFFAKVYLDFERRGKGDVARRIFDETALSKEGDQK